MTPLTQPPAQGRVFDAERTVRLSDMDATGRLRLDAVARYLQDVAGDDVDETGWGAPEHLWVMRRIRIDVVEPPVRDRRVRLATWCNGLGTVAAGRRLSLAGDAGGRIEADSIWAHLGPDGKPARLGERFSVYAEAAAGRRISTRLELPDPPPGAAVSPWPLRPADVDLMDHVNNAVHWQAVDQSLPLLGIDPTRPFTATLEYRGPIDLADRVELAVFADGARPGVALVTQAGVQAVAGVEQPLP
jgi:acyl-ACP thioesterase